MSKKSWTTDAVDSENVYPLLVGSISHEVNLLADERWNKFRANFISLVSIVTLLLTVVGSFLVNELLEIRVRNQVELSIKESLQSTLDEVEIEARFSSLSTIASQINQSNGFSNDEAQLAISQFRGLSNQIKGSDPEKLEERNRLLERPFDQLIRSFAAAGRNDFISTLAEHSPEMARNSDVVTQTLVQQFGRELIAAPGGASSWLDPKGPNAQLFAEYRNYANRAKETRFPELYLAYESILRFMEGKSKNEVGELLARASDLNDQDKSNFVRNLQALADGSFKVTQDSETAAVKKIVSDFVKEYQDGSDLLSLITIGD